MNSPSSGVEILPAPKLGDARGFSSIGIAAGLKRSGKLDLGILYSDRPCTAAGVFTTSLFAAAPVIYDRAVLRKNPKAIRAVVINSGHANAATGPAGLSLARRMGASAERSLNVPGKSVLVCSTGIIGDLPNETVLQRGIDMASRRLSSADTDFQKCILTTDKVEKVAGVRLKFPGGKTAHIVGVAKGSGMIAPNMATMLGFIVTDLAVPPDVLRKELRSASDETFNCVSVDGDTSTNDTVLLLANGSSGIRIGAGKGSSALKLFSEVLLEVCRRLAWKMVEDGEGATKVIEVAVRGARSGSSAKMAARAVAESLLVKTAIHGEDPNVGRVLAALGRSGASEIQAGLVDVSFNGVRAVRNGIVDRASSAQHLRAALRQKVVRIEIDLRAGSARGRFMSCDLSYEYVRINAEYHT